MLRRNCVLIASILLLMISGCGKLDPAAVSGIKLAAASAKERASSFGTLAGDIPEFKDHIIGLNAQADALKNISDSVDIRGNISQTAKDSMIEAAKTATARYKLYVVIMERKVSPPAWMVDHAGALKAQSELMTQVANIFIKEKADAGK